MGLSLLWAIFLVISVASTSRGSPVPAVESEETGDSSSLENYRRPSPSDGFNRGDTTGNIDLDSGEVVRHLNLTDSMQTGLFQQGSQEYWRGIRKHGARGEDMREDISENNVTISANSTKANTTFSMGNNPDNCTLEPAFLCLNDLVHFQRNKDLRLNAIKYFVMQSLYPSKLPPGPSQKTNIFETDNPFVPFSGQLQRLHASCDVPNGVDTEVWKGTGFFHIYFHIPASMSADSGSQTPLASPEDDSNESMRKFQDMIHASSVQPQATRLSSVKLGNAAAFASRRWSGRNSNVVSAKLMLYKLGRGVQDEINSLDSEALIEPLNQNQTAENYPNVEVNDEKIRVSVYWYTSPLQKHHYKKKLLDTKMISFKEARWVEFDIQRAASSWISGKPNFGLVVQVENEDNDWIDARKFFAAPPCFNVNVGNESESLTNITSDRPQVIDVLPPPELEVCTLSVPSSSSEVSERQTKTTHNHRAPTHRVGHRRHRHGHGDRQTRLQRRNGIPPTEESLLPASTTRLLNSTDRVEGRDIQTGGNAEAVADDDHPLRDILATVASRSLTESRQRRRHKTADDDVVAADYNDFYDNAEEDGENRGVVIQKIIISPPDTALRHHSRHPSSPGHRSSLISRPFPVHTANAGHTGQSLNR